MSTPEESASPSAVAVTDTEAADAAETDNVADPAAVADGGKRRSRWWVAWLLRLAWLIGIVGAGIGLYFCYLYISRTEHVGSDGASNALQAWDMLHGNPLLRGWTVTDVSFYTTELPEYMPAPPGDALVASPSGALATRPRASIGQNETL